MAEDTAYFQSILANSALLLDEEEALEGDVLVSIETAEDQQQEEDIWSWEPRPPRYLAGIRPSRIPEIIKEAPKKGPPRRWSAGQAAPHSHRAFRRGRACRSCRGGSPRDEP